MSDKLDFLRTVKPFDLLPEDVLAEVAAGLQEVQHPREGVIYFQDETKLRGLDILVEGEYETFFYDSQQNRRVVEYSRRGDCYGGVSLLLNRKKSLRTVVAKKNTRVYFLHRREFLALCQGYEGFFHFFTARYGQRMLNEEYAHFVRPLTSAGQSYLASDQLFSRRIETLELRPMVLCAAYTPIHEVARRMAEARTSCYFITDADVDGRIIGYVTDITLRDKVVAGLADARLPVETILDAPVVSISSRAFVYEAILLMFRTKTRYLLVETDGEYVGFLSRNKLLTDDQAQSPFIFIQSVKQAQAVPELKRRWEQVPEMVYQLLNRGVKPEIVNQVITTVSDTIALKLIEGAIAELGPPPARFVYMVLGSEGRKEQTLLTDQDNAIIYEDKANEQRELVRAYFLKFAEMVSDQLNAIGFSYCEGGFMAKNPKWTHSLSHWKRNYVEWMTEANPETGMQFAASFDCRYIYGDADIMDELHDFLDAELQKPRERFFHYMAVNALQYEPPLTFFRNIRTFAVGSQQVFNLKRTMSPIVDLVRMYALKHRIFATNTGERLEALRAAGVFTEREAQELLQSYYYLMGVRLKKQAAQIISDNVAPDNYLDPKRLTKVEQVTLKEIFKVISDFQLKIKVGFTKSLG
jgi:CBS domain-containing protein